MEDKVEEIIEGLPTMTEEKPVKKTKKTKTKEEIGKDLQEVQEAVDFSLADIEGIGPVKLKKLEGAGIRDASDLIVRGPKELGALIDIDTAACTDIIEKARAFLREKDVINKSVMTGRELLNYRTTTVQFLKSESDVFTNMLGGGYESGVLTELYGEFGSGKTQFCMEACINAQLPYYRKCFRCSQTFDDQTVERCPDCDVKTVKLGGLSEIDKPCRIIYMDTENSFRPERVLEMIYERGMVETKEQKPMEIKRGDPKEPLNDEAVDKALSFLDNIVVIKTANAGHQVMIGEELNTYLKEEGKEPVRLLILDSITSEFRFDFSGRGELGERQILLKKHIKHISRLCEVHNLVGLITNQVMKSPSSFGDPTLPIGGMTLGHTSTHRVYLKKSGKKIVAILIDSPNHAKNEGIIALTKTGVENGG